MKDRTKIRLRISLLIIPAVISGLVSCNKKNNAFTFDTAVVKKGSIVNSITATGTVEADTTVMIGTQVSGVIRKIYVDFNSVVKKGQLLAELDKTPLETQVQQAMASLDNAKSEVEYERATYNRYVALLNKKLIAQADFDQVKYNYNKALSDLKTARAGYDKAMVNLKYATIYSPIDGVVLNRAVDQGQTVAASFNTPTLFTIANNLNRMQVQANVDEADIGQVKIGQPVDFSVDAYPDDIFRGIIRQIRLEPVVTSNVVTYTVIVDAPNPEEKLMPGMTANIIVYVQRVDSVPVIPYKALKFTPDSKYLAEYGGNTTSDMRYRDNVTLPPAGNLNGNADPGPSRSFGNQQGMNGQREKRPVVVWVKSGDRIHPRQVEVGASDGINTEIKKGLDIGDEVVLAMNQETKASTSSSATSERSPFMPQRPNRRRASR